MSTVKSQLVDSIEQINEYCNDSIKGYREAADAVQSESPTLSAEWMGRANAREILSNALTERLRCLGEDGEESGTAKGAIHRGILKLKGVFTGDSVEANVKECLRGEEELRDEVNRCLTEDTIEVGTLNVLRDLKAHVDESIASLQTLK